MLRALRVIPFLAIALSFGCGGKVVYLEGAGGAGGAGSTSGSTASHASTSAGSVGNGSTGSAGLSCESVTFDFAAPTQACTTTGLCDITGTLADGRALRETCKSDGKNASCALLVEGVEVCSCPPERIDWASSCANGVPTCTGWLVDYTDITNCPTK